MSRLKLRSWIMFGLFCFTTVCAQSMDPCLDVVSSQFDRSTKLIQAAASWRTTWFRNRKHIDVFEQPVLHLVRRLRTKKEELVNNFDAAANVSMMMSEALDRIQSRRLTYEWTHLFALRAVLIFNEPYLNRRFAEVRSHEVFKRYYDGKESSWWLDTYAGSTLFLKGAISRKDLFLNHQDIFIVPVVEDETGGSWPNELYNMVEAEAVYPLVIPKSSRTVLGERMSILQDYEFQAVQISHVQSKLYDKLAKQPKALKLWKHFLNRFNLHISRISDPIEKASVNSYLFLLIQHNPALAADFAMGLASLQLPSLDQRERNLKKMSYMLVNYEDLNRHLPSHVRTGSREGIEEYLRIGERHFLSVVQEAM